MTPTLTGHRKRVFDTLVTAARADRWLSDEELADMIQVLTGEKVKVTSVARERRNVAALKGFEVEKRHDGRGLYRYRLRTL